MWLSSPELDVDEDGFIIIVCCHGTVCAGVSVCEDTFNGGVYH